MSGSRHQNVVLDANATPAWKVDPRLDRHDHPGLDGAFLIGSKTRCFVNIQADSVSQTVAEPRSETGVFDHFAGGGIHVFQNHPRADGSDPGRLRSQHNFINAFEFGRDSTGH